MNLQSSNFDFIECSMTRSCIENGCWALDHSGLWEWLRTYNVDPSKGFMFASDPEINIIGKTMEQNGAPYQQSHSGASFGFTMRNLHYIAQNGFEAYKELYLENKRKREEEKLNQVTGST